MEHTDKAIKTLKGLIFILQLSTASYQAASEDVEDPLIKESIMVYFRERSFYLLQLQHEMKKLGQPYNDDWEEYLKERDWSSKSAFCLNTFLLSCIEMEQKLILKYKLSLQEIKFYSALSLLLQNQLLGIEKSLIQITKYQQSLN